MSQQEKEIEFVFPKSSGVTGAIQPSGLMDDTIEGLSVKLQDLLKWFKEFKVDSIELWVSAAVETGHILKFFIGAKGEGGFKIILKPK